MSTGSGSLFVLLLFSAGAIGCASPGSTFEDAPLVRPGARIELGQVTAAPAVVDELAEAPTLMQAAMEEALAERDLLWSGDESADRFRLEIELADYEVGNAFKRWLLPGYGSTILAIQGRLIDLRDGKEAGRLDHRRSVSWGGGYTIGAWKTIFSSVADDVATELDNRIEGKGFVLDLRPWSARDVETAKTEHSQTFVWGDVRDAREHPGRIGERESLGVEMGSVFFGRDVPGFLRETITDELLAEGHRVEATGEGRTLELEVRDFWVETDSTALYWDVKARIAVRLVIGPASAGESPSVLQVEGKGKERTYVWPGEKVMGEALDGALVALVEELRAQPGWPR